MARTKGSFQLSGAIEPKAATPLDARMVVKTKADLIAAQSFPYAYVGMITSVQEDGKAYILTAKPTTVLANWQEIGTGAESSIQYSELPSPSQAWDGKIVQYVGENDYEHDWYTGYFYVCHEFEPDSGIYMWFPQYVQPEDSGRSIQIDAFPVPKEEYEGLLYQYVGATDPDDPTYIYGYFYECKEDPANPGTYKWTQTNTQPSGGGGGIDVDDYISPVSTNPVQNRVIAGELKRINSSIQLIGGSILTIGGQLDGINSQLASKQSINLSSSLTIDDETATTVEGALDALNRKKLDASKVNEANGVAGLNAQGQLSPAQVPNVFQYTVMPTASASNLNKIVQYVGEDGVYHKGYFYICSEVAEDDYEWIPQSVQNGEASGGELTKNITAVISVGGISQGQTYAQGTAIEDILSDLLEPILYPTFTAPSVTVSSEAAKLLETGSTKNVVINADFNRGSISPAYGTNGYRAGKAISYSWNDMSGITNNSLATVVSEANNTFHVTVRYEKGQQPLDSKGEPYDSALESGSVTSADIVFNFVDAWWSNKTDISQVAKMALIDKKDKTIDIVFPAQTAEHPEVFDIPASWTVTSIKVKNDLSGAFDDARDQFSVTNITHNNIANITVDYKRYTCNLGYGTGSRTIRITWS